MSKRNTQQRRQLIVSMLMEQNELSVDYLAQFLIPQKSPFARIYGY